VQPPLGEDEEREDEQGEHGFKVSSASSGVGSSLGAMRYHAAKHQKRTNVHVQ
jgi:hypothetical protein